MIRVEIAAYNAGVLAMIEAAERSAGAIGATTRRPLVEGFAIAALDELAWAGREMMVVAETGAKEQAPARRADA